MPIKGLQGCGKGYRFSFNGKEKIDEIIGAGNDLDFGARIYDARLGRWLSPDPLTSREPSWTPFRFCFDNPINITDPTGLLEEDGDPLENMRIRENRASNLFGTVRNGNASNHQGFDLEAQVGTAIKAVNAGTIMAVIQEAQGGFYGTQIILQYTNVDGQVRYAQYAHLSLVSVTVGQVVEEGVVIGATGQSGNARNTPPHLHFEVRTQLNVGQGLAGRVNPNEILDTQFISQNSETNQTLTGVTKIEDGNLINMNLDGTQLMTEDGRSNRPRSIIID